MYCAPWVHCGIFELTVTPWLTTTNVCTFCEHKLKPNRKSTIIKWGEQRTKYDYTETNVQKIAFFFFVDDNHRTSLWCRLCFGQDEYKQIAKKNTSIFNYYTNDCSSMEIICCKKKMPNNRWNSIFQFITSTGKPQRVPFGNTECVFNNNNCTWLLLLLLQMAILMFLNCVYGN